MPGDLAVIGRAGRSSAPGRGVEPFGQIHLAQEQHEAALPYLEEARELLAKVEDAGAATKTIEQLLAAGYHGLGRAHAEREVYAAALAAYQKAAELLERQETPQLAGGVLHDMGDV